MMRLISWNIQWGKGCDGVVDLARIVSTAKALGDADVFCFQEVSDSLANLDGGTDQSAELAALLPDHRPVFRSAIETIDSEGRTHRFGNMTLSRLPVLQIANHLLPWAHNGVPRSMRRSALEVTVQVSFGPIRIVNAHLEYYSQLHREAQIIRLLDLQEEASIDPKSAVAKHVEPYGSQTVAASSLLCGDFNFDVCDPQHALLHKSSRAGLNYRDAWISLYPDRPHQPTCGLYDHVQWKSGPDCRDFVFVSEDLTSRITRIEVDGVTAASDHQPIMIEVGA
jgi:endonuclease/exonuclease/phosphatase family metal-dependent hydrolase